MLKRVLMAGAAVIWAGAALAETKKEMTICTGTEGGAYQTAGYVLASRLSAVRVSKKDVIVTGGSPDNLNRIGDGSCDAAIVQADALIDFKKRNNAAFLTTRRIATLYPENLFVICNRLKVAGDKITSLRDQKYKVAIGDADAGMAATWRALILADPGYEKTTAIGVGGQEALSSVIDGEADCMVWVAGAKSTFMGDVASFGAGKLKLLDANDSDLLKTEIDKGVKLYTPVRFKNGSVPAWNGIMTQGLDTVSVDATFVMRSEWIDAHRAIYGELLRQIRQTIPEIRAAVGAPPLQ